MVIQRLTRAATTAVVPSSFHLVAQTRLSCLANSTTTRAFSLTCDTGSRFIRPYRVVKSNIRHLQSTQPQYPGTYTVTFHRDNSTTSTSTSSSSSSTSSTSSEQSETMAPIPPIFSLPISAYQTKTHTAPEGSITLTQPSPKIYLLTLNSPPDNRLTPQFLDAFSLALDILITTFPPGVVITTSAIPKFYSNGLDYAGAIGDPNFMPAHLYPLWRKLLTFPWPTIALVNGHCFAGGLMTAMAHDYRIMNPHKGFLCLNELDFNAPLSPAMSSMFKAKLTTATFRTMILEGKRFNALAALEAGIVDGVGALEEAVKFVKELAIDGKVREVGVGSYGLIKEEMYREAIADLDMDLKAETAWKAKKDKRRDELMEESRQKVKEWEGQGGKLRDLKPKL